MESYCVKCKKYTKNINPIVSGTSNGKSMILWKFTTYGSEKSRFIKNQEAKGLLSNLGLKTPLSKVPILDDILFWSATSLKYKMNGIVNKFLLAGEKFMPEMYLKQPGFTYSVCRPFTKDNERIQKFKETGDKNYIYKNELDKVCFQHDMAYGDFRDLARRWISKGAGFYGLNFFDKKPT